MRGTKAKAIRRAVYGDHSLKYDSILDLSKIRMLNDGVLVKPDPDQEISGILVPEEAKNKTLNGVVVATGAGRRRESNREERDDMQVEVADRVLFCEYAGSEIKIQGVFYLIMKQNDVLARYIGNRPIDLIPLSSRVFLEWEEGLPEYKNSKILMAPGTMERYYTGVILAIGPDSYDVEVGQRVFFDQFCGPQKIQYNGKRYAMILDTDVYCTIPARAEMEVCSA